LAERTRKAWDNELGSDGRWPVLGKACHELLPIIIQDH